MRTKRLHTPRHSKPVRRTVAAVPAQRQSSLPPAQRRGQPPAARHSMPASPALRYSVGICFVLAALGAAASLGFLLFEILAGVGRP